MNLSGAPANNSLNRLDSTPFSPSSLNSAVFSPSAASSGAAASVPSSSVKGSAPVCVLPCERYLVHGLCALASVSTSGKLLFCAGSGSGERSTLQSTEPEPEPDPEQVDWFSMISQGRLPTTHSTDWTQHHLSPSSLNSAVFSPSASLLWCSSLSSFIVSDSFAHLVLLLSCECCLDQPAPGRGLQRQLSQSLPGVVPARAWRACTLQACA